MKTHISKFGDFLLEKKDDMPIGETSTGKPIYNSFDDPAHKNFTGKEHNEARDLHYELSRTVDKPERKRFHSDQAVAHARAGFSAPQTIDHDTIHQIYKEGPKFPEGYDNGKWKHEDDDDELTN